MDSEVDLQNWKCQSLFSIVVHSLKAVFFLASVLLIAWATRFPRCTYVVTSPVALKLWGAKLRSGFLSHRVYQASSWAVIQAGSLGFSMCLYITSVISRLWCLDLVDFIWDFWVVLTHICSSQFDITCHKPPKSNNPLFSLTTVVDLLTLCCPWSWKPENPAIFLPLVKIVKMDRR